MSLCDNRHQITDSYSCSIPVTRNNTIDLYSLYHSVTRDTRSLIPIPAIFQKQEITSSTSIHCITLWQETPDHWPLFLHYWSKKKKQVAQSATIAHLSPMCQGQISFQKTYKWAMETRGPKLNLSELLCLSCLPATLMMIRSKIYEPAWWHHFPIISVWEIF